MKSKPKVLMIMALDTKAIEAEFMRECLEASGLEVYLLDFSVRGTGKSEADITPDQIAAAEGKTISDVRSLNQEAECLAVMIEGSIKCAQALHHRVGLSGLISAGGALGTDLGTAVMRAFPFGLPKVMISTMASGMTKPFVGTRDIVMFPSICDIVGLNTVTTRVLQNGAFALAGMAHQYKPSAPSGKPLVAISTLSVTEKCCNRIRTSLEQRGMEVMVFHTQGTGGNAMDETVADHPKTYFFEHSPYCHD